MKKWKIGILGASDIAFKRFLPALEKHEQFEFSAIAARDAVRCVPFIERFGGHCCLNYEAILNDPEIDCIYIPLPPALHAHWGKQVLSSGKHLLMEKPFTTWAVDTQKLLHLAQEMDLAVHENYMFQYHRQLAEVERIIVSGELGEIRLIRAAFTFPFRGANDFRYDVALGGGALLDCGGYPLLLASRLLGGSARICWASLNKTRDDTVDTAGSAVLQNDSGLNAHVFFGMNDTYRCELEVWGSKGSLIAERIFTAPADLPLELQIISGNGTRVVHIEQDDQFLNSISKFASLIEVPSLRKGHYKKILDQSMLIEHIRAFDVNN